MPRASGLLGLAVSLLTSVPPPPAEAPDGGLRRRALFGAQLGPVTREVRDRQKQLAGKDLAGAWAKAAATRLPAADNVPPPGGPAGPAHPRVLAIWGAADWLATRDGNAWIAEVVNRAHPGGGTFLALDGIDHFFLRAATPQESYRLFKPAEGAKPGEFNPVVVERLRGWLDETAGRAKGA